MYHAKHIAGKFDRLKLKETFYYCISAHQRPKWPMHPEILYEDNHIIVVNKPAGLLTQQDHTRLPSLMDHIKNYIKIKYNKPGNVFLGMVHRLDRDVSGVLVFARTSKAAARLSEQIRQKKMLKIYLALTRHQSAAETSKLIMLKHHLTRKRDISIIHNSSTQNSKAVSLQYKTVVSNSTYAIHLINLISGKKHQIRAQLKHIGIPIVGDKKYGSTEIMPQVCLHAYNIRFTHPTTKEKLNFYANIPPCMLDKITLDNKILDEINLLIDTIQTNH